MTAHLWQAVTWDVARAGGLVAYLLLTLAMMLGLALSLRWPRLVTNDLHSFVTLLALIFIGVHVLAVAVDPFTRFGWRDLFVPFATRYRTPWMAAGIVGTDLLLAVWISTHLRARIGYGVWRKLHGLAFAVYVLATLHGLGTGTDSRQLWALALYAGSLLLVGGLLVKRLLTPSGARGHAHPRLAALTATALASVVVWACAGPAHAALSVIAGHVL